MMAAHQVEGRDADQARQMAQLFGPGHIDQTVRQAIHHCWMALPAERRTPDGVDKQIRRIVDRVLRDFREDAEHFGVAK